MFDQASIDNIIAGLTPLQTKRLEGLHAQVKLALARNYGDRLAPIMVDALVRESTLHPATLAFLEGLGDGMPSTSEAWREFVAGLVENNELAQRNLVFSDAARKEYMRADELAKLRPDRRLSLARNGQLDQYLDQRITERLGAGL